jgi:hypothetical protein
MSDASATIAFSNGLQISGQFNRPGGIRPYGVPRRFRSLCERINSNIRATRFANHPNAPSSRDCSSAAADSLLGCNSAARAQREWKTLAAAVQRENDKLAGRPALLQCFLKV